MQISLVHAGAAPGAKDSCEVLVQSYLERCSQFARCSTQAFRSEKALLDWVKRQGGRTPVVLVLLDSRGKLLTSESFAAWTGKRRDAGAQHIVFAIGPASGWSEEARSQAQLLLSLGPMTLAHALARLVVAEQIYRAVTILTGHPYHCGH
jgi:23S rRNA (pseudouridine1915-N3)-methyltransferase